jgi:hypothetical protein
MREVMREYRLHQAGEPLSRSDSRGPINVPEVEEER